MINPIKQIHDFNHKAGLVEAGYSDFLESSFQIEEALEGFDLNMLEIGTRRKNIPGTPGYSTPKEMSRDIVAIAAMDISTGNIPPISDVDRLDKACDAVVFAVGSMTKLGLNPTQITKALNIVMNSNMAKLSCPKDEHGKLLKPDNFDSLYAPEPKLQKLLDERN